MIGQKIIFGKFKCMFLSHKKQQHLSAFVWIISMTLNYDNDG